MVRASPRAPRTLYSSFEGEYVLLLVVFSTTFDFEQYVYVSKIAGIGRLVLTTR